jgi:hypothetical protein
LGIGEAADPVHEITRHGRCKIGAAQQHPHLCDIDLSLGVDREQPARLHRCDEVGADIGPLRFQIG